MEEDMQPGGITPKRGMGRGKMITLIAIGLVVIFVLVGGKGLVEENPVGYIKVRQMPVSGSIQIKTEPGMFGQ